MGVKLKELIVRKPLQVEELKGKTLAVDSFNLLYQFITTIRLPDGSPLRDADGNVTSHLSGLFSRCTNLAQKGIKLAFVFDGKPPELKKREIERRIEIKQQAQAKYEQAAASEDLDEMKKYGGRTARLTPDMVAEAKALITALGMPYIDAPSEGEAQAAVIVKKGEAYAELSEDYDCLLFGVPRLVHNLSITGRRKVASKLVYKSIEPEIILLTENLKALGLSQEQLVALGMLVGTDYNRGGIKGIGPKKAIQLVKGCSDFDSLFSQVKWSEHFEYPWKEVFDSFFNMPVTENYNLQWNPPDKDAVLKLLCDKHGFSSERIAGVMDGLLKAANPSQKSLGAWFG